MITAAKTLDHCIVINRVASESVLTGEIVFIKKLKSPAQIFVVAV